MSESNTNIKVYQWIFYIKKDQIANSHPDYLKKSLNPYKLHMVLKPRNQHLLIVAKHIGFEIKLYWLKIWWFSNQENSARNLSTLNKHEEIPSNTE